MAGSNLDDTQATIAKAYVREMLDLNPIWQAPQIIRRRTELWRPTTADDAQVVGQNSGQNSGQNTTQASPDPIAVQRLRDRALQCVHKLQTEFYQLPAEKVEQYLRALEHDRLPEFSPQAARLRAVFQQRSALINISQEIDDQKFTYSLLQGLIQPGGQAGALREQYIEAIIAEKRVVPACRMIRDFVDRFPAIFQLERDWFNLFLDPENQRQWESQYSWRLKANAFIGNKAAAVLMVVGVIAIISAFLGETPSTETPRRSAPKAPPQTMEQVMRSDPEFRRNVERGMEAMRQLQSRTDLKPSSPHQSFPPQAPQQSSSSPFPQPKLPVLPQQLPDLGRPEIRQGGVE